MWRICKAVGSRQSAVASRQSVALAAVRRTVSRSKFIERDWFGIQLFRCKREETLQAIAERVQLGLSAIVRAAADDGFARVEEQVEHGLSGSIEVFGEGNHVRQRRV